VTAQRRHIRTIQESRRIRFEAGDVDADPAAAQGLASSDTLPEFRASLAKSILKDPDTAVVSPDTLEILKLKSGAEGRIWQRSKS
jgi:arginine N-succinyltransferase